MPILVIAAHDHHHLHPATLNTITAALQLNDAVIVLVAGEDCAAVATQAAKVQGVLRVIVADNAAYRDQLAENLSQLIVETGRDCRAIMAPANAWGKDVLPRVAALLGVAQISEIMGIEAPDTFYRPIYAGNAIAKVRSHDAIKVITVRTTAFAPANVVEHELAAIVATDKVFLPKHTQLVRRELTVSPRPELSGARVVVAGGRGLQSGENFKLLEALADQLGAAIGATRAAVDAGFVPNDYQVGQTGKVVAPAWYLAIGISGAIQHLAGMKDSQVIIAINKDPDAPIFQVADYGLVGDLFTIVPELTAKLQGEKQC